MRADSLLMLRACSRKRFLHKNWRAARDGVAHAVMAALGAGCAAASRLPLAHRPGSAARNASIDGASAHAESNRTSETGRAFDFLRGLEAERWRKVSAAGGRTVELVRIAEQVPPSPPPPLARQPPSPTAASPPPVRRQQQQQQPSHPEDEASMKHSLPMTAHQPALPSLQAAGPVSQASSGFDVESVSAVSRLGALVGVILFATRRHRCCRAGLVAGRVQGT